MLSQRHAVRDGHHDLNAKEPRPFHLDADLDGLIQRPSEKRNVRRVIAASSSVFRNPPAQLRFT